MRANIHVHCTVASERDYGGLRIWQVVHRLLIRLHMSWPNCDPIIDDLITGTVTPVTSKRRPVVRELDIVVCYIRIEPSLSKAQNLES